MTPITNKMIDTGKSTVPYSDCANPTFDQMLRSQLRLLELLVSFLLILQLAACSSSKSELDRKIRQAFADDGRISETEFQEITFFVEGRKDLDQFRNAESLYSEIDAVALNLSKRERNPLAYPPEIWRENPNEGKNVGADSTVFNVYLENSASMDGYMNGRTEFKEALLHILTTINGKDQGLRFLFINNDTFLINKEISEFIDYLEPSNLKGIGNRSNTEINKVVKTVIDKFKKDGQPAILVSDYIFSMNMETEPQVTTVKYTLKTTFQGLNGATDAILVIKNHSRFRGMYYDYQDGYEELDAVRPYYIWVVGPKDFIFKFTKSYYIERSKGFQEYFVVTSQNTEKRPYHALLGDSFKSGRFRKCRDQSTIICMENLSLNERGDINFQFALAVDLSEIPVSETYKMDISNYSVVSPRDNDIKVVDVRPIREISKNDERYRGSATHILVLSPGSDGFYKGEQTIQVRLKNQIPDWVTESSTLDDRKISTDQEKLGKTYGFEDLITGVYEAFNPDPDQCIFFELPIIIRNE